VPQALETQQGFSPAASAGKLFRASLTTNYQLLITKGMLMHRLSASLTVAVFAAVLVTVSFAQQASQLTVPNLIRYGGELRDANGVALFSATVGVTFAIYKQQDGGAPIWIETQNVTSDATGNYSALLGSTTAVGMPMDIFSAQEQRWLGIQVQGQAEQPRVLLASVPYAFKAHEAETLGGRSVSDFMLSREASGAPNSSSAGTGSGLVSINNDTTPAQSLSGGSGIGITDNGGGSHTITNTGGYGLEPVTVVHGNGGVTLYTPSGNTNTARGTALLAAFAAGANGDSVYLSANTFDLGSSALDQSLGSTGCINLYGSGKYATIITSLYSSASISYPVVRAGSYCTTANLTINNTGGTNPHLGSVWGAADSAKNHPFTHALISDVAMNGNADGIYVAETGASFEAHNLTISTTWDVVTFADIAGSYSIYDSSFKTTGSYPVVTYTDCLWTPVLFPSTTVINVFNSTCTSTDASGAATNGYYVQHGAVLNVYGGSVVTSGNSPLDLQQATTAVINVTPALVYSDAKTAGIITKVGNILKLQSVTYSGLRSLSPSLGMQVYCSNCDAPMAAGSYNACTSASGMAGAEAHYIRGTWQCF
jgi:hypothetical protein